MRCERCGKREAEVFLTQRVGEALHTLDLCGACARRDQGIVLGALLQAQTPGAPPLTAEQEAAVRRAVRHARGPRG